jgi:N-acetylneuraminic acid mutarotase
MLAAERGVTAAAVGETIYAFGPSGAVQAYDARSDRWSLAGTMPTPRQAAAAEVGGAIYVVGGYATAPVAALERFAPATNTWVARRSMPRPRAFLGAAALDGMVYALGGFECTTCQSRATSSVDRYDPTTDTWTARRPMLSARERLAAVALDGKLYAIGGFDGARTGCDRWLTSVEAYDPATDTWTARAPLPARRELLAAVAVHGKIYAFGGDFPQPGFLCEGLIPIATVNDVYQYDPLADAWVTMTSMPTARESLAAVAIGADVYAIGGSNASTGAGPLRTLELFAAP